MTDPTKMETEDVLNNSKSASKIPKHVINDGVKWLMAPSKIMLDSLSVWPERQNKTTAILHFLSLTSSLIIIFGNLCYLTDKNIDLGSMAFAASFLIVSTETVIRRVLCVFYKEKLVGILMQVYYEFWPSHIAGDGVHNELVKTSWCLVIFCFAYTFSAFLAVFQYVLLPIFSGNLPLRTKFPFPWTESPYYELLYVWESFMSFEMAFNICGLDLFFVGLLFNCVAQFKLLKSFLLVNFPRDNAKGSDESGSFNQTRAKEVLLICVKHHNKLISVCKELNEVFTYFILIQCLASIGTVCLSSFVATAVPQEFSTAIVYLMGHLLEIFIYCYMGNDLIIESSELSSAVFQCGWHLCNADRDLQRSLIVIMVRAQRPIRISVGGFGFLSLSSFAKLIRFSFSVYTLLDSQMNKQGQP